MMKRTSLILLMTLSVTAKPQRIPRSFEPYFEEDMNQIPIVMDESLYKMSCADIKKNSIAIKVLQDEMHTYMIRTDAMLLRLNKLEGIVNHRPWYKRFFHKN